MGSWRDKKVWAFTAVISRVWLTTVLWLWQASTLLPPAETASWQDYSTLAAHWSITPGEKHRDVSQQQAETTKENWNKRNELHLLWCPVTAEPHKTQGSSCGPSCGITAGVQSCSRRVETGSQKFVFSYELMYRKSGGNPDSLHHESRVSSVSRQRTRSASVMGDQKGQTLTGALKPLQPEPAQYILYPRRKHLQNMVQYSVFKEQKQIPLNCTLQDEGVYRILPIEIA